MHERIDPSMRSVKISLLCAISDSISPILSSEAALNSSLFLYTTYKRLQTKPTLASELLSAQIQALWGLQEATLQLKGQE